MRVLVLLLTTTFSVAAAAWSPDQVQLDAWTESAVRAVLTPGAGVVYPNSIRPVSKFEQIRNEIFFRGFLGLKGRVLKPQTGSALDALAGAMDRVRQSPARVLLRGSVFNRLNGLLAHSAIRNGEGKRDLGQFAGYHREFLADIQADSREFGSQFFEREVVAQGAVNSFAIKLFAWMNGRRLVPDRGAVNSIALLHPLVDAAMDKGWMKPETFAKLQAYLFEAKTPVTQGDYERMLFAYLARFEKPFPRTTVPGFWFSLGRLFQTQVRSLKQKKSGMSLDDYYRIALDKGGLSTVLAAYTALGPLSPKQYEFFYRSGGVFQVLDDLLDIAKDMSEGVRTVWTSALAQRRSMAEPLAQLLALESRIEDELPDLTSQFADPQTFANVYSFGFKLSLMRGLARQQHLLEPAAQALLAGRLSLSLSSFQRLMSPSAASVPVEEGSDLWLFQELVQATEDY